MECKTCGQRRDILCCCLCPDRAQAQVPYKWDLPNQERRVHQQCVSAMHGPHLDARKAHITGNAAQGTSAPGDPWYALSAHGVTACGRVAGSGTRSILGFASLCSLEHFLHGHHSNIQLEIACCGLGVDCLGELIQNSGNIQDTWISIADDKYGYLLDPIFVLSYTLYSLRQSLANASFLDCLDFTSSFCLIGLI